jgi:hypothetical protein
MCISCVLIACRFSLPHARGDETPLLAPQSELVREPEVLAGISGDKNRV